jgi:hypothetical protein
MSIECVKCGNDNSAEAALCSRGTWPFSPEAWPLTSLILRRVTIDTSCINAKRKNVHLNRIEQWAANGHLLIQRADVMLEELNGRERLAKAEQTEPHPEGWLLGIPGRSDLGITTFLSGPDFEDPIRHILFPSVHRLSTGQRRDVEHLRSHLLSGGDAFLTLNTRDFINNGKREALSKIGIWVFTPEGLVSLLEDLYGWPRADA